MKNKAKYVNAKVYNSTSKTFQFPEMEETELQNKKNVGICFSGGGTRSASLSTGQLRGLNHIGVLEQVKYVSAVSGGCWGCLPYFFLDKGISDAQLLGEYVAPEKLTLEGIKASPEFSMSKAISSSKIFDDFLENIYSGDELYVNLISNIFLKPLNLGNKHKFFTYNQQSLNKILQNNPHLEPEDFYLVNPKKNRPFPIFGGTILRPRFGRYQFEMTPLYVGADGLHEGAGSNNKFDIGGGYVEPHGFDSDSPEKFDAETNLARVRLGRLKHRFTLADVMGTSGAAPAEYVERFGLGWIGFPEYKYWSPNSPVNTKAKEYDFGDGGILENIGIMPMLKRKVKKLIIFVNCQTKLSHSIEGKPNISNSITALFKPLVNLYGDDQFNDNIVFANQEDKYQALIKGLSDKIRAGEPAIYKDRYAVTPQVHHNIKGGYEVEILWFYNARLNNWVNKLPLEIRKPFDKHDFGERFPNYKTFMENMPQLINLEPEQVNLMGHQAAWSIVESAKEIKKFMA